MLFIKYIVPFSIKHLSDHSLISSLVVQNVMYIPQPKRNVLTQNVYTTTWKKYVRNFTSTKVMSI